MLSFSAFLIAAIIIIALRLERSQRGRVFWIGAAAVVGILLVGGIWWWPGILQIQRGLTKLASPGGLLWLSLLALGFKAWQQRDRSWTIRMLVIFMGVTLVANNGTAYLLMKWWQQPYLSIRPLEEGPFDIVIVLGGGTELGFNNNLQLNGAGDRLFLGARLYHNGRTAVLGCSGRHMKKWMDDSMDPASQGIALLNEVGVRPAARVSVQGRNTAEEIAAIRAASRIHKWERIGLVTSAWHLRRAMRLARKADLRCQPLPADFRGQLHSVRDWSIIPDAEALVDVTLLFKEWLAVALGR